MLCANMPLQKRWAKIHNVRPLPNEIGAYELAYNKNLINIGSGVIGDRVPAKDFTYTHIRWEVTKSRRRAVQMERRELFNYGSKDSELPKYNSEIPDPP